MDARLSEIRQRLANLDQIPARSSWAGEYDIFLEHAEADVRWLVEQMEKK